MMYNKAVFELFQKLHLQIYANHQAIHDIINYSASIIWQVWKGRGKIQKIEYLKNEKRFFGEVKNIFNSF